jgi:hypothetical protein
LQLVKAQVGKRGRPVVGWYERYVGQVQQQKIADQVRKIDEQRDHWAIVHFAVGLAPIAAEGLTAAQVANELVAFSALRRRLRV